MIFCGSDDKVRISKERQEAMGKTEIKAVGMKARGHRGRKKALEWRECI